MATSRDDFVIAIRSAFLKKANKQRFSLFGLIFISIGLILFSKINLPFTNYLISKSYFLINQNQKAEKILLKYLQKRSKDFLGWELYSLIVNDEIKKIQALCKSYISNIDESELVNIKIELIKLLIKNKYLSEAKSLSLKLPLSFRNKNIKIIARMHPLYMNEKLCKKYCGKSNDFFEERLTSKYQGTLIFKNPKTIEYGDRMSEVIYPINDIDLSLIHI